MINTDQKTLLELLKVSLFDQHVCFSSDTDWNNVFEIARKHALVALTEYGVPEPFKPKWRTTSLKSIAHYVRVLKMQDRIIQSFQAHDVPTAILKGSAASMYYPNPAYRAMGDIDILVSVEKYKDAQKLLEENGLKFIKEDYRNSTYIGNKVEIELHYHFSAKEKDIEYIISEGLHNAVQYKIENYSFPGLPKNINGIILLEHVRQHLVRSGLGLRQIIDWMMFVNSGLDDEAWENDFRPMLSKTGLEKLAVTLTYMCRKWMGLPIKIIWCNSADDEVADLLLARIIADGNFGREKPALEDAIRQLNSKNAFKNLQKAGLTH